MSKCICKSCDKEFESYKRIEPCMQCDEGYQECDWDFDEGSGYRKCKNCYGKGEFEINETQFCDDDCLVDYHQTMFPNSIND